MGSSGGNLKTTLKS